MGVYAIGTATIGNDISVGVKVRQEPLQILQRDIHCAGDMAQIKLICGAHVKDRDGAFSDACGQIIAVDGFGGISAARQPAQDFVDLRKVAFSSCRRRSISASVLSSFRL